MGRTERKRKKRKLDNACRDLAKMIDLQKSVRVKCPKIKIDYFNDTGWGVKCKVNLQKGDVLIALPLCHLITPNVQSDIFNVLNRENLPSQLILSLFLIYEVHLKTESNYFNYINSLPQTYTNLYFCTEEEVKFLPNFLREELLSQKQTLEEYFNVLCKITNGKRCTHCGEALIDIFVYEKFIWAWFTVNTRSVYYQDDSNSKSMALAPFLDMFNHSNNADTQMIIDFKNNVYILKTLVKYKKFEQVFIKYGAHSNLKLLLDYGFTVPENENDFVEFTFEEIIESAKTVDVDFGKLSKLKRNFIQSNNLNRILTKSKEFFSWNFNTLVCVLISTDQELLKLQSKIYSNTFTSSKKTEIEKVGSAVAARKARELQQNLKQMENLGKCSESFLLAKNLVEIYMNILNENKSK